MILASGSPRRLELLRQMGFSPVVRPANIDETPRPGESPTDLVLRLARQKARACEKGLPEKLLGQVVIAADTTVWIDGLELGKPHDDEDACAMLTRLSGRTHHVSTGVCMLAPAGEASFVETSSVTFFELSPDQIDAYVQSGEPRDKAGSYGIQGRGRLLVSGIEGDYFNIVGLPVARLARELDALVGEDAGGEASVVCGALRGEPCLGR